MQSVRRAAWYCKLSPTFSDALALVRKELWAHVTFQWSPADTDTDRYGKSPAGIRGAPYRDALLCGLNG
jgi:hypothetical protein